MKKLNISAMTADELNTHLQSLKCTIVVGEIDDNMATSDMM